MESGAIVLYAPDNNPVKRCQTTSNDNKQLFIMANKKYEVIDQMFSAVLSQNESEATIKALRPQVEQAVQALIEERGLPKNFTGVIPYNGFKIRVQRPKSYTWEKNTQIQDANLDFYKQLHGYYEQLQDNVKEARADLKRAAEKLEKAHPDSESIKHGLTIALMA
jgi:hypothetical protein